MKTVLKEKNAAKRGSAELCLTVFWVKVTEVNFITNFKMIAVPNELYRFLATPGIVIKLYYLQVTRLYGFHGDILRRGEFVSLAIQIK